MEVYSYFVPSKYITCPAEPAVLLPVPPLVTASVPVTSVVSLRLILPLDNTPLALFLTIPVVLNLPIIRSPASPTELNVRSLAPNGITVAPVNGPPSRTVSFVRVRPFSYL